MLYRIVLSTFCFFIAINALAQNFEKPDYKSIEQTIKDKNSIWYYPSLMKRFRENDTTLTLRDYRMLYYGNFFQDDYPASPLSEDKDSLGSYIKRPLTPQNIHRVIETGEKCLTSAPFDIRTINILISAYIKNGDSITADKYRYKLRKIIGVILSSGDGLTEETAMHVLTVEDEYVILNVYGLDFVSQALTRQQCDYLEVKANKENIKGLYFDVTMIFKYEYGKFLGSDNKNEK
jgi:hypothetical protein